MLAKIDFDVDKLNSFGQSVGVTYGKNITDSADGDLIEIYGIGSTSHDMWKRYSAEAENVLVQRNTEKQRGVWFINGHNFHIDLEDMITHDIVNSYPSLETASPYFVTDNIDTVQKYYSKEIQDPTREFVISVSTVNKDDQQDPDSGWRYDKWGEFVGDVQPDSEYIYDSTVHNTVYCVHIYEVKAK